MPYKQQDDSHVSCCGQGPALVPLAGRIVPWVRVRVRGINYGDYVSHSRGRHRRPRNGKPVMIAAAGLTAAAAIVGGTVPASASVSQAAYTGIPGHVESVKVRESVMTVTYLTVRRGDTLSGLAGKFCHNPADWTGLYLKNQRVIGGNPNAIVPGQKLVLVCYQGHVNVPAQAATAADVTRHTGHVHVVISRHASHYSFAGLEGLWESAGGPGWAAWAAATIAECESGGNVYAYNPSGATGLWQILGAVVPGNLYDPFVNALNAVSKFRASGDTFAQWVCRA